MAEITIGSWKQKNYVASWNYKIIILTGQQIKDNKSCPKIFKKQIRKDTKTNNATFQLQIPSHRKTNMTNGHQPLITPG